MTELIYRRQRVVQPSGDITVTNLQNNTTIGIANWSDWAAYTPTITAGTGSFTTVSAVGRWKQIGKLVFVQATITITTNGTAATSVKATLPATANSNAVLIARETAISGTGCFGQVDSATASVGILTGASGYPGGNGASIRFSGCYEAQ